MSLGLLRNSKVLSRKVLIKPKVRFQSHKINSQDSVPVPETPIQKSVTHAKEYITKLQADIKPILNPYLSKVNHASEQIRRLTTDVSDSKEAIKRLSQALNEVTGYTHIDSIKHKVKEQAQMFEKARDEVQGAKIAYEEAIGTRSSTQRDINELLQRKHLWTGEDVTKFTELYRLEHEHSKIELIAKERYQKSEKQMDREYMELARSMMERYHEEQLWSDKIRSVSTYGTWALMGLNIMLFITVQTIFEPQKRKRLTDRFEELLVNKVIEEEEKFKGIFESLNEKDKLLMEQQMKIMEKINLLLEHSIFDIKEEKVERLDDRIILNERILDIKKEKIELDNEELFRILLLSPSPYEFENAPFYKTEEIKVDNSNILIYSIESAIAGSLVTAIIFYLFKG